MFAHNSLYVMATAALLGLATLAAPQASTQRQALRVAERGLCGCTCAVSPTQGVAGAPGEFNRLPDATTDQGMAEILGALAQAIVETELSHAAVSGGFHSTIAVAVAGTRVDLQVCRDAIVGQVSVLPRMPVGFVVADFDRDGVADVAIRHPGSPDWTLDLGARRNLPSSGPLSI